MPAIRRYYLAARYGDFSLRFMMLLPRRYYAIFAFRYGDAQLRSHDTLRCYYDMCRLI